MTVFCSLSGREVPVLGREGLPLRVKAAVDHADQVVLAERPLCQSHGSQAGRLHTRQREHTVHSRDEAARDDVAKKKKEKKKKERNESLCLFSE